MYGEGIIDRLNNEYLYDDDNPGRKLLLGTIGEWLDNYDSHIFDMLVITAEGEYLDLHGKEYGVYRETDESDSDYRERILVKKNNRNNIPTLRKKGIEFWIHYTDTKNEVLTSKNTYIDMKYMVHTPNLKVENQIKNSQLNSTGGIKQWI